MLARQVLFQLSQLPTLDTGDLFFWFLLFGRGRQRLCCGQALTQLQVEWPPRIFCSLSFRIKILFLDFEVFMPCNVHVTKECEVSIRNPKNITYKGCGVWVGQLFSFPVAPLARERLWGVGTYSCDCHEVSHIVSSEWIELHVSFVGASLCLFLYVQVHVCRRKCTCVPMCVEGRGQPQLSFLRYHLFWFFETVSHCFGTCQVGWGSRSGGPQELIVSASPVLGSSMLCYTWLYYYYVCMWGFQSIELKSSQWHGKRFTSWVLCSSCGCSILLPPGWASVIGIHLVTFSLQDQPVITPVTLSLALTAVTRSAVALSPFGIWIMVIFFLTFSCLGAKRVQGWGTAAASLANGEGWKPKFTLRLLRDLLVGCAWMPCPQGRKVSLSGLREVKMQDPLLPHGNQGRHTQSVQDEAFAFFCPLGKLACWLGRRKSKQAQPEICIRV